MKILVSGGFHRNEYTSPVVWEVAKGLDKGGYDVTPGWVPLHATAWGYMLEWKPVKEVFRVLNMARVYHSLNNGYDVILDMHATREEVLNPKGKKASRLKFMSENDFLKYTDCAIMFIPPEDGGYAENRYAIEIPQVYRRSSGRSLRTFNQRTGGEIDFDSMDINDNAIIDESYFLLSPARTATLEKYPPEVLAKIIVRGVEKHILSKHKN